MFLYLRVRIVARISEMRIEKRSIFPAGDYRNLVRTMLSRLEKRSAGEEENTRNINLHCLVFVRYERQTHILSLRSRSRPRSSSRIINLVASRKIRSFYRAERAKVIKEIVGLSGNNTANIPAVYISDVRVC